MEKHNQLNDDEFERQFEDTSFAPTLFSHEGHLRLAWIHLKKYGLDEACKNICTQILKFDMAHDKGEKFNRTVTIASIKAVHHFMKKSNSNNFHDFINEFPRLKTNFKDLLDQHYSFDIFNNKQAIRKYLEPDLLAFE